MGQQGELVRVCMCGRGGGGKSKLLSELASTQIVLLWWVRMRFTVCVPYQPGLSESVHCGLTVDCDTINLCLLGYRAAGSGLRPTSLLARRAGCWSHHIECAALFTRCHRALTSINHHSHGYTYPLPPVCCRPHPSSVADVRVVCGQACVSGCSAGSSGAVCPPTPPQRCYAAL